MHLFPTIITYQSIALSAIAAHRKTFVQTRNKNNISVKPIVFFSLFSTYIEYEKLPEGVSKWLKLKNLNVLQLLLKLYQNFS